MNLIAAAVIIFWFMDSRTRLVKAPQNVMVIGFMISVALSQLMNLYFHGAMQGFSDMLKYVMLYFFVANLLDSEDRLKIFVWLLVLLTCYMAVQGIIQYVTGVGRGGETMFQGRIRFIGIFNDPNDMAMALVIVIPFLLAFMSKEHSTLSRAASLICICPVLYALWLTNSRGGMLSFGATIMFYIYKNYGKFKSIIFGSLIIAVIVIYGPSRVSEIDVKEASAHGRIVGMAHGFWQMRASFKNYLFGSGYGKIADEYGHVAHNTVMQVAGEIGLIGLFFFIAFIYFSVKSLINIHGDTINLPLTLRQMSFSLLASFVGFFVATLFLSRSYNELIYMQTGCAVALSQMAQQKNPVLKSVLSGIELRRIFFIEIAIIIAAYIIVRMYFNI